MAESPKDIQYLHKGAANKMPVFLAVFIALIAGGVSIWGVNSVGLTAGIPDTSSVKIAPPIVSLPASSAERDSLLSQGSKIHQENCAGCHAVDSKLIGPSYMEICRKYGESIEVKGQPTPGVSEQINGSAISAISHAVTHPAYAWDGYQRGPDLILPAEQRRAVAVWIFNFSNEKEGADD